VEGFISRSEGGGYYVTGLDQEDIIEIFGIRNVLESYAVKLAAQRRRQDEIDLLAEKIDEYQMTLEEGQLLELPDINTQLHDLFYSMSHSCRLIKMINELKNQILRFRGFLLHSQDRASLSNEDHKKIMECIRNRDADRAEKLMKEHILRGQNIVLQEFKKC
ncbi:MAG: FCD domain-containing protein, partial [Desulfovermiculus sp.]|nr:FCD domain-containing protein [Desulfovermiculus sp.]